MRNRACKRTAKFDVYHYLFTLDLDFEFWWVLISLNLTVDKLSSPWGSCGEPQFRRMCEGSLYLRTLCQFAVILQEL